MRNMTSTRTNGYTRKHTKNNTQVQSTRLPSIKTREGVPLLYHEPYVETGFRELHQPWSYYWRSLFQIHNESLNVWTHLIALFITLYQFVCFCREEDVINDHWTWPLFCAFLIGFILYACSAGAHLFHSRSEFTHHVCFMVDYAGIGLYGFGSCGVHFAYCTEDDLYHAIKAFYLTMSVIMGANSCLCNCYAKVSYKRPYPYQRRLWQIVGVGSAYVLLMIPLLHRFYSCYYYSLHCDASLPWHVLQIVSFISSAVFFASDFPQRFFKAGTFDIYGHSHQLFHVFIVLTTYFQIEAVRVDLRLERDMFARRPAPTFMNTFGLTFFMIFLEVVILCTHVHVLKRQKTDKDD